MKPLAFPLLALALSACSLSMPAPDLPMPGDHERGPFIPRDVYPAPPNVERLIAPGDCQGAQLAAAEAPFPDYPPRAWRNGRQGWVIVRFDVLASGEVDDAEIARSVPPDTFDREARRTVRNWRFRALQGVERLDNCVVMFEFRAGNVTVR